MYEYDALLLRLRPCISLAALAWAPPRTSLPVGEEERHHRRSNFLPLLTYSVLATKITARSPYRAREKDQSLPSYFRLRD